MHRADHGYFIWSTWWGHQGYNPVKLMSDRASCLALFSQLFVAFPFICTYSSTFDFVFVSVFFTWYCRNTHTLLLNQSVAKPKTLDISTQTSCATQFPAWSLGLSFDEFYRLLLLLRWKANEPGEENNIKSDVEGFRFYGVRFLIAYSL